MWEIGNLRLWIPLLVPPMRKVNYCCKIDHLKSIQFLFGSKFIIYGCEYACKVADVCHEQFWFAMINFWVKWPFSRKFHPKLCQCKPKLVNANFSHIDIVIVIVIVIVDILVSGYYELRTQN